MNNMQFQEIENEISIDDGLASSNYASSDDIDLKEQIDESSLDAFWDEIDDDIRKDPEWFDFADK